MTVNLAIQVIMNILGPQRSPQGWHFPKAHADHGPGPPESDPVDRLTSIMLEDGRGPLWCPDCPKSIPATSRKATDRWRVEEPRHGSRRQSHVDPSLTQETFNEAKENDNVYHDEPWVSCGLLGDSGTVSRDYAFTKLRLRLHEFRWPP